MFHERAFRYKLGLSFCSLGVSILLFWYIFTAYSFSEDKPNIILIETDSLRSDHLGCYGYTRNTSPNIDVFSGSATLYQNCFSPATWTMPANYSLLTSLYLPQHRMLQWNMILDARIPNLISALYDSGYSIGVFGSHGFVLKNIEKNFGEKLNGYGEGYSPQATREALLWLDSQKSPFFLWVYYIQPHRPYRPPAPHNRLFPYKTDTQAHMNKTRILYWTGGKSFSKAATDDGVDILSYNIAQYDGEIHYVDEIIGNLLSGLKEKNLFDKSIIIFLSDHGESLGEHRLYFNHVWNLFNPIIKVPLIVKIPEQHRKNINSENVSLIDIFPTLLDMAGIAKKYNALEGEVLKNKYLKQREIFSYIESKFPCLIYGKWKLIEYPGNNRGRFVYIKSYFDAYPGEKYQFFNIKDDPVENMNLAEIERIKFEQMKSMLSRQKNRVNVLRRETKTFELDEMKKRLKSLGYL